jgi:hypothetical protein
MDHFRPIILTIRRRMSDCTYKLSGKLPTYIYHYITIIGVMHLPGDFYPSRFSPLPGKGGNYLRNVNFLRFAALFFTFISRPCNKPITPACHNNLTQTDQQGYSMKIKPTRRLYQSYLLRIWKDNIDGEWRASLQNVATDECQNFATLNDLYEYLNRQSKVDFISQARPEGRPGLKLLDE